MKNNISEKFTEKHENELVDRIQETRDSIEQNMDMDFEELKVLLDTLDDAMDSVQNKISVNKQLNELSHIVKNMTTVCEECKLRRGGVDKAQRLIKSFQVKK